MLFRSQVSLDRESADVIANGTLDSDGHLLLPEIELPADRNLVYYRSRAEDLDPSVIAPIRYGLEGEKPHQRKVTLDLSDYQTTYLVGSQPNTEMRIVHVAYLHGDEEAAAHRLTLRDPLVDVRGFDADQPGTQTAEIRFRDDVIGTVSFELITASDLTDYPVEALSFGDKPRAVYMVGSDFPRSDNGLIQVKYRGGLTTDPIPLDARTEDGEYTVKVSGYEPFKPGRQRLTFAYGGETLTMGVTVEPANTEYLGQVIAPLEELTAGPNSETVPHALRQEALEALGRGRELHADPLAVQRDVNAAASRIEELTAQIRDHQTKS